MLAKYCLVLLKWGFWQAATAGVCLVLINRWFILWADGPSKTFTIILAGLVSVVTALWMASQIPLVLLVMPTAVLILLGGGELRRAWLRSSYHVQTNRTSSPASDVMGPNTTQALQVQRYRIAAPSGTPNLRIAQLTDFHFGRALPDSYFDEVFERVRAEAPDLIILTGDFVSKAASLPIMRRVMPRLPTAPLGTFAVLGNHDYWAKAEDQVREQLVSQGVHLLGGACQPILEQGARRVVLCGDESPWGPTPQRDPLAPDDYVIVLSHTPDNIYSWSHHADIVFAGHNHGGQLRVPGLGALVVPSIYGRRFDWGHFKIDRAHLVVSAGIGVDTPPFRLFCPPEIVIVDLVR